MRDETRSIEIPSGGSLSTRVVGSGPPVVMIHGSMLSHRMWDPQLEAFGSQYTVIAYDVRGYGKSLLMPGITFSDHTDLREVLQVLGYESAHIVGHSMGGAVALGFAREYPSATRSLVMIPGTMPGWGDPVWMREDFPAVERAIAEGQYARARDMALNLPPMRSLERRPAVRARVAAIIDEHQWTAPWDKVECLTMPSPDIGERLAEVAVPVLLITGTEEDGNFVHAADRMAREMPDARRAIIADGGHMVSMERPEEFNQVVLEFLGAVEGQAAAEGGP